MKLIPSHRLHRINNIIRQSYRRFSTPVVKNVILCPGQSSQYVGMISQSSIVTSKMRQMIETANKILGYDIVEVCERGPDQLLSRTAYCQPAVVIATLLAHELLKDNVKDSGDEVNFGAVAGYSVGEVSALFLSNVLSYEEALLLLKERAHAMEYACNVDPSGMLSMQGLTFDEVRSLCDDLSAINPPHSVSIAIEQFPKAVSLGGSQNLLKMIMNREHTLLKDEKKVKLAMVNVSGAFHTKYMLPAQERLASLLHTLDFQPSTMEVYCNVTGSKYDTDSNDIPDLLVRQLAEPVLWSAICENIKHDNSGSNLNFYEIGPGKQLRTILSKIDRKFLRSAKNISL